MTHILFLMSDTGGGHRAACRAIQAALDTRSPGQFSYELVDVWKDYYPHPFNTMPKTYTRWVNTSPATYAAQYWFNDRVFSLRPFSHVYCRLMFGRMKRLYSDHPADLIVSAHSVFTRPAIYALRRLGLTKPFITVITDWALPTAWWYDARADRTLAPTPPAYQRGLRLGLPPEKIRLTGAPVHPKFTGLALTKAEARAQLGWPGAARIALLIGGGDGMGPLVETAQAVDARAPEGVELTIIAGRNDALRATLEAQRWRHPTRIYGFVENMPILMRAADLLITKAGPATITEAAILGLPMVLSGAIWFQESPNIDYVVANKAGVYAPGPQKAAESVAALFSDSGQVLAILAEEVRKLAEPDAIWKIADEISAFA